MKGRILLAGESLHDFVERMRVAAIREALTDEAGVRAATARRLGISREGLYKHLRRMGVPPARPGPRRAPRARQITLDDALASAGSGRIEDVSQGGAAGD